MNDPRLDSMTDERLDELDNLRVDSTSGDAQYNPDIWALEQARVELVAEVRRLRREGASPSVASVPQPVSEATQAQAETMRRLLAASMERGLGDQQGELADAAVRAGLLWQCDNGHYNHIDVTTCQDKYCDAPRSEEAPSWS